MTPRWLRLAANALVAASLADGTLSLFEEVLRAVTGIEALLPLRAVLARLVFVGMGVALLALALTPRLPLAVFLPLALGTLWLNLGAAPLGLWLDSAAAFGIVGSTLQIALSLTALAAIRRHNGGRRPWFDADSPSAPAFAWSRSLGFSAGAAFLGLPLAAAYVALLCTTWVHEATAGFVAFDLEGVSLADRRYARGEQEIRLVGMMHIGEEDAYRDLVESFSTESTVVLAEGLTDHTGLLEATLAYGGAAEALGLAPQRDLRDYLADEADPDAPPPAWPEIRHADLDASDFSPETLDWLRWASGIWASPDLRTALARIADSMQETDPEQLAAFQYDILDRRNENLFVEIDAALDDYRRVVVPWGALHLPAVEEAVAERGFEETGRALHPLISWSSVLGALL